jgi:membrane dipeptidase
VNTFSRLPITRRDAIGLLAAGSLGAIPSWAKNRQFSEKDYREAVVIDAQGGFDAPIDAQDSIAVFQNRARRDAKDSGLTAISMTVGAVGNGSHRMDSIVESIGRTNAFIAQFPDEFLHVARSSDLRNAKQTGRTGLIYNIQDTGALEGEVSRVRLLKGLGVQIIQLTYNKRNLSGDGCLEPGNAGLSDFGRQVIHEINAARALLDLSHAGQRTLAESVKASSSPIVVSHTGCRDLVDNQRNLYDTQMRQVADKGGVVGIYFIAYLRSGIGQPALNARASDLIAHLEHAVDVCGEEHVGLGTDGSVSMLVVDGRALAFQKHRFEERVRQQVATAGEGPDVFNYVVEYNSPRRFFSLAADLSKRGWSARRIERILGGNFARVFGEVWDA